MPDYISGVYNYCDRWCERCHLTARCRSFALEQAIRRQGEDVDAAFWEVFDDRTAANPEFEALLAEAAEEVDDDWSQHLGIAFGEDDRSFGKAEDEPLAQAAHAYGMQMRAWMRKHDPRSHDEAGPSPSGLGPAADDALAVVMWYGLQIGVKLMRAFHGEHALQEDLQFADIGDDADYGDEDAEEDVAVGPSDELDGTDDLDGVEPIDELQFDDGTEYDESAGLVFTDDQHDHSDDDIVAAVRDSERTDRDGSAKVALIGIERSLGAWTQLRDVFPGEVQSIRHFQRLLARMRVETDRQFPGARVFRRPGFEDPA